MQITVARIPTNKFVITKSKLLLKQQLFIIIIFIYFYFTFSFPYFPGRKNPALQVPLVVESAFSKVS